MSEKRIAPNVLREPRLGIHEDGTEQLKSWSDLYDQCNKAADYIAQLEAQLAAHKENEGDECPLCVCEAQVEALQRRINALEQNTSKSVLRRIDAMLD